MVQLGWVLCAVVGLADSFSYKFPVTKYRVGVCLCAWEIFLPPLSHGSKAAALFFFVPAACSKKLGGLAFARFRVVKFAKGLLRTGLATASLVVRVELSASSRYTSRIFLFHSVERPVVTSFGWDLWWDFPYPDTLVKQRLAGSFGLDFWALISVIERNTNYNYTTTSDLL